MTGLPAALFIGDVSGPLNAEAGALAEELDPKLEEIKVCLCVHMQPGLCLLMQSNARLSVIALYIYTCCPWCWYHTISCHIIRYGCVPNM